jgi:hypothetical protein
MEQLIFRREVVSSELRTVGYNADALILEVEFQNERVYQYHAVPPPIFESLLTAQSKGRFFNANIRDQYAYTRLR